MPDPSYMAALHPKSVGGISELIFAIIKVYLKVYEGITKAQTFFFWSREEVKRLSSSTHPGIKQFPWNSLDLDLGFRFKAEFGRQKKNIADRKSGLGIGLQNEKWRIG